MQRAVNFLILAGIATLAINANASPSTASKLTSTRNPIFDPTALDLKVDPCQNFYQYSCGNWLARTTIPSDQGQWARSFSVVDEQNIAVLNTVLADYAKGSLTPSTPYAKKLGDYYAACMDETKIEAASPAMLKSEILKISNLKSKNELPEMLASLHLVGTEAFFSGGPSADLHRPDLQIAEIDQDGLTLPNSTYYLKTDAASVTLRQKFRDHMVRLLKLAGLKPDQASHVAAEAYAIEEELAKLSLPPELLQDPTKLYHMNTFADLKNKAPAFDWTAYFKGLGIPAPQELNLAEPEFVVGFSRLVQNSDLDRLKSYLIWKQVEAIAPLMNKVVYNEFFDFAGKTLSGAQEPAPRWKRCLRSTSHSMGEALGQAFVAKSFSPAAKQRALKMIADIRLAFLADLKTLDWLDDPTRVAALAKLDLITQKIGYPDKWRNYDALKISRTSYLKNAQAARVFESRRQLAKIGGKTDPTEWGMSPQTVNAYYDPSVNQINFPAGILQAPFFSDQANDASNYGAIGMVIGHEITHGFDTSGSQFDGHGAQVDWWTPTVKKLFDQKAQCLVDQYSKFEPLPGVFVNGKLTVTENIADQGGLKLAFEAYRLSRQGQKEEAADSGLSANQQFFVSMAQVWCDKQSDQSLRQQVAGNSHSPAQFRVMGTIANSHNFANAFNCQAGAPMAPSNRCEIW